LFYLNQIPGNKMKPQLQVLYDGACPLCSREIAYYRGLTAREPIAWLDISNEQQSLPPGINRCYALSRFHLVGHNGEVWQGARAFLRLWRALPGWRYLGYALAVPPVPSLLELAYRGFLKVRARVLS
jgi:predicted DCC family thiol-disulfide oxidoreductase YuxK